MCIRDRGIIATSRRRVSPRTISRSVPTSWPNTGLTALYQSTVSQRCWSVRIWNGQDVHAPNFANGAAEPRIQPTLLKAKKRRTRAAFSLFALRTACELAVRSAFSSQLIQLADQDAGMN